MTVFFFFFLLTVEINIVFGCTVLQVKENMDNLALKKVKKNSRTEQVF